MKNSIVEESNRIKNLMGLYEQNIPDSISLILPEDNEEVIDLLQATFEHFGYDRQILRDKLSKRINNNLSIKIVDNNKIVGVYLLAEKSIPEFLSQINNNEIADFPKERTIINLEDNLTEDGIQGIALAVLPEFRDLGYGKKLKEYVRNLGYDYIWGVQDKNLKNIDFWLNSRKIFAESPSRYATYEVFK